MTYKPGDSYFTLFVIDTPGSGAAADADALPVATACRNGADDGGFALTVTRMDAGRYKAAGTVPGGYAAGDTVNVWVSATVSGAACKSVVDKFGVDARRLADGVLLAAAGLDAVQVEAGVNARQALSPILAASAGVVAGQGTGSVTIKAGGNPSVTRIAAATDGSNNRTAVTLTLPA